MLLRWETQLHKFPPFLGGRGGDKATPLPFLSNIYSQERGETSPLRYVALLRAYLSLQTISAMDLN